MYNNLIIEKNININNIPDAVDRFIDLGVDILVLKGILTHINQSAYSQINIDFQSLRKLIKWEENTLKEKINVISKELMNKYQISIKRNGSKLENAIMKP